MIAIVCDRCGKVITQCGYVTVNIDFKTPENAGIFDGIVGFIHAPKYQDSAHLCTDCADKLIQFLDEYTDEEEVEDDEQTAD